MRLFTRPVVLMLVCLLAVFASACGPAYDYDYGYPRYGFAPYWSSFYGGDARFAVHHPWEEHGFGHPMAFYHAPVNHFASAGHFGGFHGGGFHGGADHR